MDEKIAQVKKAQPAHGTQRIPYIPGERRAEKMRQSLKEGVILAPGTIKILDSLSKELGVLSLFPKK